ncbi:hypothetical protein NUW54_g2926 [Trametes sanguinea]|uniref:Uncharacterized protein n=1 Tax=Trametes sanguinea TaxID=158606 RepID=A0ACC1Q4F9_9APHY|nr:hypothetical protein NUW54_g2926 [Trametes sanguinea]
MHNRSIDILGTLNRQLRSTTGIYRPTSNSDLVNPVGFARPYLTTAKATTVGSDEEVGLHHGTFTVKSPPSTFAPRSIASMMMPIAFAVESALNIAPIAAARSIRGSPRDSIGQSDVYVYFDESPTTPYYAAPVPPLATHQAVPSSHIMQLPGHCFTVSGSGIPTKDVSALVPAYLALRSHPPKQILRSLSLTMVTPELRAETQLSYDRSAGETRP